MDMDDVEVYHLNTVGLEVEVTTTYELNEEMLESLPPKIEISEEVQEEMEREANVLVEHAVQNFIQNSPLMRDHLYMMTDEGRASTFGSEESSEEEESDQDSDDTEAQQVRGQGTGGVVGPRLNMILPDDLILEDLAAIWMTDTEE
ncbi:hypothetical protein RRG08_040251 [Elysia crispata]|uniref:Uncharacterized protein n=1 Tax=Elysia crispata TaxID=231223 RepID=A0AAE1CPW5_9GAST|nr:hypothetical protein RRG08_040251 [Elysia crispata]